jgi:hypothetical protein
MATRRAAPENLVKWPALARLPTVCPRPVTVPRPGVLILAPLPVKNPADDHPEGRPLAGTPRAPTVLGDEGILWLVSFSDDDDRELRPPDIAEALRRGEIDGETIVWRDGLEDWAPLGSIPSLARLLPASGETANAPLVVSSQTVTIPAGGAVGAGVSRPPASRAKGNEPAKPSGRPLADQPTKTIVIAADPKESIPSTSPEETRPDPESPAAVTSGEPWRGKTRVGLPKAPEAKVTSAALTKKADAGAPKVARTPETPKVEQGALSSKRMGSIWDDDDDEPVSVDPESMRPLSPTPAIANATALSRGTLGMPNKPPPPAPRPPGAKPAPPAPAATSGVRKEKPLQSETPPIGALAGVSAPAKHVDEDILNLGGGGGMGARMLALPALDLDAFGEEPTFSAERPPLDAPDVPLVDEETATVPKATEVAPRPGAVRAPTPASVGKAEPVKKRSLVPLVLGGAVVAYALSIGVRKLASTEAVSPPQESQRAEDPRPAPEPPAPTPARAEPPPPAAEPAEPTSRMVGSRATAKAETTTATPKEPKAEVASKLVSEKKAETPASPEPEPKQVDMGGEFDKAAAGVALGAATTQASGCRKGGDPTGVAVVHVTFANSGRATRATIEGPPFAGTATGGCIAAALRGATVPPFGGDRVTVTKRVVIQ